THRYGFAWSEESDQIAYIELQTTLADESQSSALWVYDLETSATRQITPLDLSDVSEVIWFDTDILLVYNPSSDSDDFDPGARGIRIISPRTGEPNFDEIMPYVFEGDGRSSVLAFYEGSGRPVILRNETYFSRQHMTYDVLARIYRRVDGRIARFSAANTDTSLRVIGGTRDQLSTNTYWRVFDGDTEVAAFGENVNTQPDLSPDGRGAVISRRARDSERLPSLVYRDGAVTALPFDLGRPAWGQTDVEIVPDGDLNANCNLPDRVLVPYETATVLPGSPNNVRTDPDTTADITGAIAAGETFTPLASFCDGGIRWWFVEHGVAQRGWTAERVGVDVFVGPAS
ncbi:MAG: hypothetical protein AAF125_24980, partial [Chloroflexota bacterium]